MTKRQPLGQKVSRHDNQAQAAAFFETLEPRLLLSTYDVSFGQISSLYMEADPGQPRSLTFEIQNAGPDAAMLAVDLIASTDPDVANSPSQSLLGSGYNSAPVGIQDGIVFFYAPQDPGFYYISLHAVPDGVDYDLDLSNNWSTVIGLNVTSVPPLETGIVVTIPDSNLEQAIRWELDKPTGDLTETDLASLVSLPADDIGISSLEGLQYCVNLTYLDLSGNYISDLSPLQGLAQLEYLYLDVNNISDIGALANLAQIYYLDLSGNYISDLSPLQGLAQLQYLYLDVNSISDIQALVDNPGLGDGDEVDLRDNPLSQAAMDGQISSLEARGVNVYHDTYVGVSAEGYINDFATGLPLEGITVELFQNDFWDWIASAETDASGRYQFSGVSDGTYIVRVYDGQSVNEVCYLGRNTYDVQIVGGEMVPLPGIELREAGILYGCVYDETGEPLANAEMVADVEFAEDDDFGWHNVWTDASGRYELYLPVTSDEVYPVWMRRAESGGGQVSYAQQVAPGLYSASVDGVQGPDFHLQPGGVITGHVVTADGAPVTFISPVELMAVVDGGVIWYDEWTGDAGDFALLGVPTGVNVNIMTATWGWNRFEVEGQRYAWGEGWLGTYNLQPGQMLDIGTIVVRRAASLTGYVTDGQGNPIAGAEVSVLGYDVDGRGIDDEYSVTTDEQGFYSLDVLPAGRFEVLAGADGYLDGRLGQVLTAAPDEAVEADLVLTSASQGAIVNGVITNFAEAAPKNDAGTALPYQFVDYEEVGRVEEIGVVAFDSTIPWSVWDLLLIDSRLSDNTDAEDGWGDYMKPLTGQGGTFQLTIPAGDQTVFAYRGGPGSVAGWYVNFSQPLVLTGLTAGQSISQAGLLFDLGTSTVIGTISFPAGYPGNVGDDSVSVYLRRVGDSDGMGVAMGEPGPGGEYSIADLAAGEYYVYAVADGLAPFISVPFTLGEGAEAVVDVAFQYVVNAPEIAITDDSGDANDQAADLGTAIVGHGSQRYFTVSNTGTAALLLSGFDIGGANPTDFWYSIIGGQDIGDGITMVDPAQSAMIEVFFSPLGLGPRTAEITFNTNDLDEDAVTLTLSGTGIEDAPAYKSDLTVAMTSAPLAQVEPGELLRFDYRLQNIGMLGAGAFQSRIYVSGDDSVDESDTPVQGGNWSGLATLAYVDGYMSFHAPTTPGLYYYAIKADSLGEVDEDYESNNWTGVVLVEVLDAPGVTYDIADFFPLEPGFVRTYQTSVHDPAGKDTTTLAFSIVQPGTTQIGGDDVREVRQYYAGRHDRSTYYSVGPDGLKLYRQQYAGRTTFTDFVDGLVMAPAQLEVGQTYSSSAAWECEGSGGWSGEYSQQLTIVGFEEVVLPHGTFTALRLDFVIDADKEGSGVDMGIHDVYSTWMVEGVGIVKQAGTWGETSGNGAPRTWQFDYQMLSYGEAEPQGDLVVRFSERFVPPDLAVPGQAFRVPVVLENIGSGQASGAVAVELYAQSVADSSQILLVRQENVRLNLVPGQSATVSLNFTAPTDLPPGEYLFLAKVDADDVVSELDEENNEALASVSAEWVHRFGNVGLSKRVSLTITDVNGTPVTFSLTGNGYGEVVRNEDGQLDVILHGTDSRSSLTIKTSRESEAVVNDIRVVREQVGENEWLGGSLGAITAPTTDLAGDILSADGWLGSIVLDDVVDGHLIQIGGAEAQRPVSLTFGSVGELSVVSASPISRLTATEWLDGDDEADEIRAPWLGRLRITGDSDQTLGHFGADLVLSGQGAAKTTLGQASIAGDLYDALWGITGDMGRLSAGGIAEHARVQTTGSMGAIRLGASVGSDFLAGVAGEMRRAANYDDFDNIEAGIASVTITGVSLPDVEVDPYFFEDSNFSAAHIGKVALLNLQTDNGEETFGFFAAADGEKLGPISHTDTVTGRRWTWPVDEDVDLLDFTAEVFTRPG